MANEFKHGTVGTELTQAEWEAVGTHVVANQAIGDLIYASSTSQLRRLGISGTGTHILSISGGVPVWAAPAAAAAGSLTGSTLASGVTASSLTSLGTIATGVWQATDVGVAYGGTGVSSLTANGVLVGNGASAIGSIDMSVKGKILIGDGSGNPQMLAVGTNDHVLTADSGETTGVKWAAAAAAAAGSLTGSTLASGVTASSLTSVGTIATGVWQGTDVGVAYGGTGVSTLTDGGILLGSGASAITAMSVLTDGQMIVGDGSTDPVAESGATLRTSIGVGTGDSPEFTDLTVSDDLTLNSDAAVLNMGAGNDFTITHDGTTGATLAGNPITITSAGAATWSSSSGALTLTSAAAATWSTAAGILTIDGDDGIILNTGGSGNVQVNESLLVGVDDTGYDVKFFGATAGQYCLWDESADSLIVAGNVYIKDSSNANLTSGLTINQGAADDEAFALKSSDVAQPMTGIAEADTYLAISKSEATSGGAMITGLKDSDGVAGSAVHIRGLLGEAADTTKTTSGQGVIELRALIYDGGTNVASVGTNGNLVRIGNGGNARFLFDAEGSGHADVEWTTYATHDDLSLVAEMERELLLHEDEAKTQRRHMLEEVGIIGEGSWHMEEGRPKAMVNFTKLSMLHHGALIQASERIKTLENRLLALEGA